MRVKYHPPSENLYDVAFRDNFTRGNTGGGLDDIRVYKRRGGSFLGFLGRALKTAIPFIKNLIVPEIRGFTNNVLDDVSQNVPLRDTMKRNFKTSVKNIGTRVMRGGGKRRKTSVKRKKLVRKSRKKVKNKTKRKTKRKNHCKVKSSDIFTNGQFDL